MYGSIQSSRENPRRSQESGERRFPFLYLSGLLAAITLVALVVVSTSSRGFVAMTNEEEDSMVATATSKPHIIYILIDDLGYNSLGDDDNDLYGLYPNMKSLMDDGLVLEKYYAQEVCTPSRASLLTGRYPLTVGMQYGVASIDTAFALDTGETLFPEVLQKHSYSTHMLGKWHLGSASPRHLPTARGFDSFIGFLGGSERYWSKKAGGLKYRFHDFLNATEECYSPYEGDDMHNYSTYFYRDQAIDIISSHDSDASRLFLYIALQAVHNPFTDINNYENGIPTEYLDDDMYELIMSNVTGRKRRQLAMALNIVDSAVGDIVDALDDADMSDNGGCFAAGGRNGGLRGTKGSLFDGGTRVDAFVYSERFSSSMRGQSYEHIFHVSDWFPTLLDMANIDFHAKSGYELDGISHYTAMKESSSSPREYLLYNYYHEVEGHYFDMWTNGTFAVRNNRYKLLHAFDVYPYSSWLETDDIMDDDQSIDDIAECYQATEGTFTYYFFDLSDDPYETTNLYNSTNSNHVAIKEKLYEQLDVYAANARSESVYSDNLAAEVVWKENGNTVVPFVIIDDDDDDDDSDSTSSYPANCYST